MILIAYLIHEIPDVHSRVVDSLHHAGEVQAHVHGVHGSGQGSRQLHVMIWNGHIDVLFDDDQICCVIGHRINCPIIVELIIAMNNYPSKFILVVKKEAFFSTYLNRCTNKRRSWNPDLFLTPSENSPEAKDRGKNEPCTFVHTK